MSQYRNPVSTVDIIIEVTEEGISPGDEKKIVLIERKNPPYGWAIPGGFVDYGESLEQAAVREAKEETSLDVELVRQFHTYSEPGRDPRQHTVSTVYIASAEGKPVGCDDAKRAELFSIDRLPDDMAFDHHKILEDYKLKRY
ncbi:MAG: NUDIX hydrolase [Spirochaetes bacterium]|nr:NUDIX hydrolase [Spirochaetota bacterium]